MKLQITMMCLALVSLLSCENDDNVNTSSIQEQADTGAVVEVVALTNNSLTVGTAEGSLETTLEYRDGENGSLLDTMTVYITFMDNTENEGDTSSALVNQEVLFTTVDAASFGTGTNGFPVYDLAISSLEFLAATSNTTESIAVSDIFSTRFELLLTDGRIFSSSNIGNNGGLNSDFTINTEVR